MQNNQTTCTMDERFEHLNLLQKRDILRKRANRSQNVQDRDQFKAVRDELKSKIKNAKRNFYQKALSSRRPKEVWKTIHRILNPDRSPLKEDPNKLNEQFNTIQPLNV